MNCILIDRDFLRKEIEELSRRYFKIDLSLTIDYLKIKASLSCEKCYVYTGRPELKESELSGKEKEFLSALNAEENKFIGKDGVYYRYGKVTTDGKGDIRQKGVDVLLAIDAVRILENSSADRIVIFTGDSDFVPLLDYALFKGKRVEVFGSGKTGRDIRGRTDRFHSLNILSLRDYTRGNESLFPVIHGFNQFPLSGSKLESELKIDHPTFKLYKLQITDYSQFPIKLVSRQPKIILCLNHYSNYTYACGDDLELVREYLLKTQGL